MFQFYSCFYLSPYAFPSLKIIKQIVQDRVVTLQALQDILKDKGHNVTLATSSSVAQGIKRLGEESIIANSDFRKGGAPDGY